MKKLYGDDSVVEIILKPGATWHSILNTPDAEKKLSAKNEEGDGFVYLRWFGGKGPNKKRVGVCQPHLGYSELKEFLRSQKGKKEYMVFVSFDSVINQVAHITEGPVISEKVFVVDMMGKRIFLGEPIRPESSDHVISKECIIIEAVFKGNAYEFFFPILNNNRAELMANLAEGRLIKFSGMRVSSLITAKKLFKGTPSVEQKFAYVVNEYEAFDDPFDDILKMIPKINSKDDLHIFVDVNTGKPFFSSDINMILLFNAMYVKTSEPVFNVTLSGISGAGKTSCATLFAKVFSRDGRFISANMSTAKGLVPAYGGERASPGMLIYPRNFLKVVDELFRRAHKEALSKGLKDPTAQVYNFLSEAMNVVERNPHAIGGSGKGMLPVDMYMKDSFMGSDNLIPDIRNALDTMVLTDKAVMRRFTFLLVDEKDADAIKSATERPSHDDMYKKINIIFEKKGFSLGDLKRFAQWFRKEATDIKIDPLRCKIATEEMESELFKDTIVMDFNPGSLELRVDEMVKEVADKWTVELNLVPFYEGFVRCCALLRSVIEMGEEKFPVVEVEDADYEEARTYFRRLFKDTFSVYKGGLWRAYQNEDEGIKRVFGGVHG